MKGAEQWASGKRSGFAWVRLSLGTPGDLYAPPLDDRLVALIRRVERREIPSSKTSVPLAELEVHHPPTLEKVRANLRENPSTHNSLVKLMLDERPRLLVYRNEAGRLVMFDDYAKFAVAQELGFRQVRVQILGE